jgi:ABC-type dipeptide/oligopeptide/nickel transport system permease subunit
MAQPTAAPTTAAARLAELPVAAAPVRPWAGAWSRFRRNRAAVIAALAIVLAISGALVGPLLWQARPTFGDFAHPNAFPGGAHPLGTDLDGRDVLARLLSGLQVSLVVVVAVETFNVVVGGTLGLLTGYRGGWLDEVLLRFADVFLAFPGLLLAILLAGVFGAAASGLPGGRLLIVALAIAAVNWPLMTRYVRSRTLSLKRQEFVEAARALGATDPHIMRRHILPNVAGLIVAAATLDAVNVVISEATLSLLGLGVQVPQSSIGQMIVQAVPYIDLNWTEVFFPAATLTALVLAFSFLGDGLRDALDPVAAR